MKRQKMYEARPFKTRNADELNYAEILDYFVDPGKSISNPFEYENSIIKGKMGTGKTMYLKANQAYYMYTLIPSLLDADSPIIPIYIKLSDFQSFSDPKIIYKNIILKIIKEMCTSYEFLERSSNLAMLHKGFLAIPDILIKGSDGLKAVLSEYKKLSSEEYIEKVSKETKMGIKGSKNIFEAFYEYFSHNEIELKNTPEPSISDIENAYNSLLKKKDGKLLILLDEAGSLNRTFFKSTDESDSFFEILMNQLRTITYVRTKIAIYPQTYTDVLTETRYGDVINLQENIEEEAGFLVFKKRITNILLKYCKEYLENKEGIEEIFLINIKEEDPIEQLINASYGNMRRLLNLIDLSFKFTYEENPKLKVTYNNVLRALENNATNLESLFSEPEKQFLNSLAVSCRNRSTYKFTMPKFAPVLYKYLNRSSEYNVINIIESGIGRRSSLYGFDYAFCVKYQIPTHYIKKSERLDKNRSRITGEWISRVATMSEDILRNAEIPGKIEGVIEFLKDGSGFIKADDELSYFFQRDDFIESDRGKYIYKGMKVRIIALKLEKYNYASNIECL
ncbi:MAG: hypothetical protein WC679_13005 [Bacteroidales bacterium]|jgi:hypothetical protein